MQNKTITILYAWILTSLVSPVCYGQYIEYSAQAMSYDFKRELLEWNPLSPDVSFPNAYGITYAHQLTPFLSYYIPFRTGHLDFNNAGDKPGTKHWFIDGDLALKLEILNHRYWVSPYIWAGVGAYYVFNDPKGEGFLPKIPVGAGFKFKLYKRVFAELFTSYSRNVTVNRGHFIYGAGIKYVWGKGIPRKRIPVHISMDSDQDGIPDESDACPEIAGIQAFNGCPDTDGDLIPDTEDECPDVAGIKANHGCPLMSLQEEKPKEPADSVELASISEEGQPKGEIPQEKDRDGDGIPDSLDLCPDRPGRKAYNGCPDEQGQKEPAKSKETPQDKIPQTAEPNKQIAKEMKKPVADRDGDGVPDASDNCPEIAGVASNHGCPERDDDQDGVPNSKDKCPFLAGSVFHDGCPEKTEKNEAPEATKDKKDITVSHKPEKQQETHNLNGQMPQKEVRNADSVNHKVSLDTQPKTIIRYDTVIRKVIIYDTIKKEVVLETGMADYQKMSTGEKEETPHIIPETTEEHPLVFESKETRLHFRYKLGALSPKHIHVLDELVKELKKNPDLYVLVSASANEYSSSGYNNMLAGKRIAAISKYLEIRHISPQRIVKDDQLSNTEPQDRDGRILLMLR